LEEDFKKCQNRLIILDEDILISINKQNDIISEKLLYDLNKLSSYENNVVFILSKESKSYMLKQYHKKAPFLGLAAENGLFCRL
jgi:trehalose-6-phosphatase